MRRTLSLLAVAVCLTACGRKPEPQEAVEKPASIVPLEARDPSALVMGPASYGRPAAYKADPDAPAASRTAEPSAQPDRPRAAGRRGERAPMPKGYRAVSLPIRGYESLDVRPGDRVDVLSVFDALSQGGGKEKLCATILQNVRVLDVGAPGQGVLQLMLNPTEAQTAVLAVRQGELAVIRRQAGDADVYPMEMSSYRKFFR